MWRAPHALWPMRYGPIMSREQGASPQLPFTRGFRRRKERRRTPRAWPDPFKVVMRIGRLERPGRGRVAWSGRADEACDLRFGEVLAVTLVVRRSEPGDIGGIERLSRRLEAAGQRLPVYGEDPASHAGREDSPLRERLYVAADGDEIRGAVWLREQAFWIRGERVRAGWAKYPVAESLIDRRFSGVPAALILRLLREQPRLLALGLGGRDTPFARLLAGMKWVGSTIPFQFLMVRPARALREIRHGGYGRPGRFLRWLLARSGVGWAGYKLFTGARSLFGAGLRGDCVGEVVTDFGPWADEIWRRNRERYGLAGLRDSVMLNLLYRDDLEGIARLRVRCAGEDVGWLCCLRVDLRDTAGDEHFGRLAVGLLADGFAAPEHARGTLGAGLQYLLDSDVDLIFSNQAHPAWTSALGRLGFLKGPSNFAFYRSPAVETLLSNGARDLFINRGDCDGPRWAGPGRADARGELG